ncbi:MAG: PD-(D/E)XK nuclease family protein [Oscillospiraceae bacterium]|jgi:ATP-dependent helicase/nuclease subunit B|nr:PD-(D/E)XK nuclease family protein [Oscillospiraceae bacterium]
MLTLLTGRSGRLWPRIIAEMGEAHAAGAPSLLLIVPNQYTLQAEVELVGRLDLPGLLHIEVLSPERLLTRVFAVAGSPERVRIDGRGKAMMLTDVLQKSRKSLRYFEGSAERRGFVDRLSAHIAAFKRAGLTAEELAEKAAALPKGDALADKLADLSLIYARYEERLSGAFLDGEDAQDALRERLPGSGMLDRARVWVYGFDDLSGQFLRLLAVMARGAQSVRLALTLDQAAAPDGAAFEAARKTMARLARHWDTEGLLWEREHIADALPAAPEIAHLEAQLFAARPQSLPQSAEAVSLFVARDPYDEAMRAAEGLVCAAREGGIRFDEMAVVAGDLEGYAGAIETAFARSGIPFHLARKRPALAHPLLRGWLAAIRCVTRDWRAEDALDWLKSGLCALEPDGTDQLENYAIEHGLRGAKWRREIADPALEALRAQFTQPLEALQARLAKARRDKDSAGVLAAAYALLEDVDAYATLQQWQQDFSARGLFTEAADCALAWRLLLETLDQLYALQPTDAAPLGGAALSQVLESGLRAAELGALPASPGAVQVGQLGHAKLGGGIRLLYLIGMQDGVLHRGEVSLLTDAETARAADLTGAGDAFEPKGDALAQRMQVGLLDTLAAPAERLVISYALSNAAGDAQRPAAVLERMRRILALPPPELAEGLLFHAPGVALDAMGGALRAAAARGDHLPDETAEAASWLLKAPETRAQAARILAQLAAPASREALPPGGARALYLHTRASVSRLETFARCPYQHFITYGVRPSPRRAFEVAPDETGTFYHRAMEDYTRAAIRHPDWPNLSHEASDALMDAALAPLRAEWADAPLGDNAMRRALGDAFCRIARRAAWTYASQSRKSLFRTEDSEARFGTMGTLPPLPLHLPDGRTIFLEGRIDRIDLFQDDGNNYLRVVDYKSGGMALDPSRVYAGQQLQLLLYLSAALAAHPGAQAAGAFYARFWDPLAKVDSRDPEEIEAVLADKLRLKGVMLGDMRVVRAMEDGQNLITKKGELRKDDRLLPKEGMDALLRHAHSKAEGLSGRIGTGEIHPRPAELGTWRACAQCDYRSICGYDAALPGHAPNPMEKLRKFADLADRIGKK